LWSPLNRLVSNKALFIPIDFSDQPGTTSPNEMYGQDVRKFKEWVQYYSNGKFAIETQTLDTWVRASQPSKAYDPYLVYGNSNVKTGYEMLLEDAEKFFDKGNKAAGVRVRKSLQDVKALAQEIRKQISEKNSDDKKA
jgi:hypothetical protein